MLQTGGPTTWTTHLLPTAGCALLHSPLWCGVFAVLQPSGVRRGMVTSDGPGDGALTRRDSTYELEQAIEAALLERSRRNELILAILRAGTLSLSAAVNVVAWLRPQIAEVTSVPIQMPLVTIVGAVLSVSFALLLWRGWYNRALQWTVPLVDATGAATGVYVARQALGPELWASGGSFTVMTMLCCVLTLTGAFRLSTAAMSSAAAVALAIFITYGLLTPSLLWPAFGVQLALLLFVCGAGFAFTGSGAARYERKSARSRCDASCPHKWSRAPWTTRSP
jgi:hypothetical protein